MRNSVFGCMASLTYATSTSPHKLDVDNTENGQTFPLFEVNRKRREDLSEQQEIT